ncbi:flagellar basal body P-ring formation chaperone FlgA [Polycladidibacter hongkongensis]|uniref:flagellar basal body P-ring formation chaperone FlgA n=1 Tax=Polycladidibacter hongkongensis TaxID=1647556 RepID=UPI00082AEA04|nr:flagellar basal body P-ring formation chaperone FlgA [Pseudovibrio hongkongensis]
MKLSRTKLGAALAALWLASSLTGAHAASKIVTLPVAGVVIYPGDQITIGMLREKNFSRRSIGALSVMRSPDQLIGKEARRTLLVGQPIPKSAIREPIIIKRGSAATLVFREDGLEIRAVVEPLESGSVGDVIKAKNLDTGLNVTGRVQPDGSLLATGG